VAEESKPASSPSPSRSTSSSSSSETPSEKLGIQNPWVSDADVDERYKDLDPTKVVGRYAEQPDPNDDIGPPLPNIHEGVNEAPADDDEDTPAVPATADDAKDLS
jgi:hypothetical protein